MSSQSRSSRCSAEHDECMICLCPLFAQDNDTEEDGYITNSSDSQEDIKSTNNEGETVGAIWPCGHVFHISCYSQWKGERCPNCNQVASLFSRIYISAPEPKQIPANLELSYKERRELERYRRLEREEEQDRLVLCDLETRSKDDPQGAKLMTTMMLMMQAKELRKAEAELLDNQQSLETNEEILTLTQSELEGALDQLQEYKSKAESLQDELDMLKRVRWENATQRSQEHKSQINALKAKYDRAKEKLALKNRQLARRNKELAAKRKLISAHKMELAAKGQEHERMCEKTKEALRLKEKELEILRELDSLGDSFSFSASNHSLQWE